MAKSSIRIDTRKIRRMREDAGRSLRGKLGAHVRFAGSSREERIAATAPARAAFLARFEREVDPDGTLDPAERALRARHARAAHMIRLRLNRSTK
jgi:hypothetical protein